MQASRNAARKNRQARVRGKISGTPDCPRLNVYRSLKHIAVQIIDDTKGVTLVSCSSLDPQFKGQYGGNIAIAEAIGEEIAKRAKAAKITKVVFDRAGYLYHGRVKAVAEGARKGGLEF